MESGLDKTIDWLQRITVETLDLEVKPSELDPDREFMDLEVIRFGDAVRLDSMNLVDVIAVLEDAFDVELLEDEEFREAGFTIRCMASFLISRFGEARVLALAESAKSTSNRPQGPG